MLAMSDNYETSRAWLQDRLWGSREPSHAQASLRRELSNLRKRVNAAGSELIQVDNQRAWLDAEKVSVDARDPSAADRSQREEFLEGIDIPGEEGFEDWLRLQRNALAALLEESAERSTPQRSVTSGEPATVKPEADEAVLPSIAVLPFKPRLAGDENLAVCDLLAEEITLCLSRRDDLHVISHLSCRNFSSATTTIDKVEELLGVNYILTGNLFLDGNDLRLVLELHEVQSKRLLWARDLNDVLDLLLRGESDLPHQIVRHVTRSIAAESVRQVLVQPLPTLRSHSMLMASITLMHRESDENFQQARTLLADLIARLPNVAILYAWMAKWYALKIQNQKGLTEDRTQDTQAAVENAQRALELDPNCSLALAVDGFINTHLFRDLDTARKQFELATEINPNDAYSWLLRGTLHAFQDEPDPAVAYTTKARRLSPMDPEFYFFESLSATAHLAAQDNAMALDLANASLRRNARHPSTLRVKTIALCQMGRMDEARQVAGELMQLQPNLTVSDYLSQHPAAAYRSGKAWASALREAGVPA